MLERLGSAQSENGLGNQGVKVSYAVVGHPKRAKQASELAYALDAEVAMDNGRGSNANHDAAWMLYDPWAPWHVVIEDDAILTPGFLQQAAAALAAVPGDGAVSFYLGGGRPKPSEAPKAIRMAQHYNAHWVRAESSYWGVALALPTPYVLDMVGYVQRSTLPYDIRLSTWLRHKGLPCWHTVPSLVDHADYNSLIWDTNVPIRKAIITGSNTVWNSKYVVM